MKTIFISSFHVLISRNILAAPFLDLLLTEGWRVVLLVPQEKQIFFTAEFSRPGVVIQWVSPPPTRREVLLRYLSLAALDTRTLSIKRKTELKGRGEWLVRIIGNRRVAHAVLRWLDRRIASREPFAALIRDYRPDCVLATDVGHEYDTRLIHASSDAGVLVVGMVRSWDNLTSKGLIRAVPDLLLVNNEIVKSEAMKLHGVPESRIRVFGIPHYDRYPEPAHPRGEFCRRLGLNPAKRFLVYAPTGDRYLAKNRVDQEVIRIIVAALPPGHELLVRLPPSDSVAIETEAMPSGVIAHRPGAHLSSQSGVFKSNELTRDDDDLLRDTLAYCELVVVGPSTIVIDAAVFDKPIILVGFDGASSPPYYESIRRYWDYDHFQSVLRSDGVRLARNKEELAEWIQRYLSDSSLDREGRKRITREQGFQLDGQSSRRLVAALKETLKS